VNYSGRDIRSRPTLDTIEQRVPYPPPQPLEVSCSALQRGAERRERFSAQTRLGGGGTRGFEERSRRLKVTRFSFRGRGKEFDD